MWKILSIFFDHFSIASLIAKMRGSLLKRYNMKIISSRNKTWIYLHDSDLIRQNFQNTIVNRTWNFVNGGSLETSSVPSKLPFHKISQDYNCVFSLVECLLLVLYMCAVYNWSGIKHSVKSYDTGSKQFFLRFSLFIVMGGYLVIGLKNVILLLEYGSNLSFCI